MSTARLRITPPRPMTRFGPLAGTLAFSAALLVMPLAASAQYKVVGPDGKITYTDRPELAPNGSRVSDVATSGAGQSDLDPRIARLPYGLRQAVRLAPVTLYTSAGCAPCVRARDLLTRRGVPFQELTIRGDEESDVLQRATGSRTVPTLSVGGRMLHGLLDTDWQSALDGAGYPAESQLPTGWRQASPRALGDQDRRASAATQGIRSERPVRSAAPAAPSRRGPANTPANPTGIKF